MKEKRRWIAALLAVAIMLSLTGCARRGETSSDRSTRSTSRGKNSTGRNDSSGRRDSSRGKSDRSKATEAPTIPEATRAPETVPETTAETFPQHKEPLVFDDRRASYSGEDPQWESMYFTWEDQLGVGTRFIEVPVDKQMYRYYRNLERYTELDDFCLYATDENNQKIIADIIQGIREETKDLHYDDAAMAKEIAKFVQDAIEYQYDSDTTGRQEYPRYPIETLYEKQGDCEDTSILMAALLKEWGYEVGFLILPGHCAVAIRAADDYASTSYYEINGHRYLYIESTGSGWEIGKVPEDMMQYSAKLYLIP